ncbi:uncharacterized protein FFNC_15408 [Fusarium fujikuroi]|nr:uncharacterized protein FFNC_15408 [Fusarium fujikuroi]
MSKRFTAGIGPATKIQSRTKDEVSAARYPYACRDQHRFSPNSNFSNESQPLLP